MFREMMSQGKLLTPQDRETDRQIQKITNYSRRNVWAEAIIETSSGIEKSKL